MLDLKKISGEFDALLKTKTKEDLEKWLRMDKKRMKKERIPRKDKKSLKKEGERFKKELKNSPLLKGTGRSFKTAEEFKSYVNKKG